MAFWGVRAGSSGEQEEFALEHDCVVVGWDEALDELPPDQKEIFIMNEFNGISFKEISELKGININTLLSKKRYAILFLRKRLKNLYEELKNV